MAIFVRRITWIDASGNSRTTSMYANASAAAVQVALLNDSNADYALESEAQLFANAAPAPVVAVYQDVIDEADLWFTTAIGEIIQVTLPAPKSTIFMADQMTVNPASVAGVIATVIGVIVSPAGNPATAFLGGSRSRQR